MNKMLFNADHMEKRKESILQDRIREQGQNLQDGTGGISIYALLQEKSL